MNRILGNVTPPEPDAEGRSTHAQWAEQDTYQHRETDNQQGQSPRPRPPPHPGKATLGTVWHLPAMWNRLHSDKFPAVSSGATWTLSLRNFLWTCITQVQSTFATEITLEKQKLFQVMVMSAWYLNWKQSSKTCILVVSSWQCHLCYSCWFVMFCTVLIF